MDISFRRLKKRPLLWTLLISLLIHLLCLILFVNWGELVLFPESAVDMPNPQRQVQFEIVETPRSSDTPPEEADLYSDKDAVAADQNVDENTGLDPYVEGLVDNRNILVPVETPQDIEPQPENEPESVEQELLEDQVTIIKPQQSNFSRDRLLAYQQQEQQTSQPLHNQRSNGARDVGSISLNTYAWDYAPYLLDLKRRIEKNIFPPPIFTRMGFGGRNVLRFRIMPDGTLVGPDLLDSSGEKALINTSKNAVKYSVPFKPLPEDFPEEYLEVTARFDYMIIGQQ